ncbi:MAG: hypothetical protein ACD_29C00017G0002 [uncultured bacterium]|nr:MAG: hypothetical protein ACD_29C00017G0002 [uncultured bacterium]
MINDLNNVIEFNLPEKNHELFFAENNTLPILVKRIFIIKSKKNTKRGHHAHKKLSQYLICVHGICDVLCDDGKNRKNFLLDHPAKALLIPPVIWSEQNYLATDTTLLVACDDTYDESDYIRDYDQFIKYRGA